MSLVEGIGDAFEAVGAALKNSIPRSSGVTVVEHGSNGAVARPAGAARVDWHGTAEPVNAIPPDLWIEA